MQSSLIIQLARFGDVVQTKRLVRTLRARGEVRLCVDRSLEALARLVYPDVEVFGIAAHGSLDGAALALNRRVFAALADGAVSDVYNLNHAGLNRALARLFAPEIVRGHGMENDQPLRSPWVRLAFRWTGARPIAPLNLVDFWAWFAANPLAPETINPVAQGQGRGLGVVLAGRESRRSLPPPALAQVVRTAFEALGGPEIFLFGSAAERPMARQLMRHVPSPVLGKITDLSGRTDWKGLAEALTGLDAVLTPDTGTMHLAAHLGVPVRAFFLSSAWCHETGPYGLGHTVWQAVTPCAPCLEAAPCRENMECLAPFSLPALLRGVAGSLNPGSWAVGSTPSALPLEVACFSSALDSLGGTWRLEAGRDSAAPRRAALRALVAEYLGCPLPESGAEGNEDLIAMLYQEADWMIPPRFAGRYADVC